MKKVSIVGLALAGSLLVAGCGKHDADTTVTNDVTLNEEGVPADSNLADLNAIDDGTTLGNASDAPLDNGVALENAALGNTATANAQ